jgi:hypothetical protein
VIVVVPIAVGVPAVVVLIPPLMPFTPAAFTRVVQFTTFVVCLPAMVSMLLNRFVEFMLGVHDPALTPVNVFCLGARNSSTKQKHGDSDKGQK